MDKDDLINELKKLPYGMKVLIAESYIIGGTIQVREISSLGTGLGVDNNGVETYYAMIYLTPKAE